MSYRLRGSGVRVTEKNGGAGHACGDTWADRPMSSPSSGVALRRPVGTGPARRAAHALRLRLEPCRRAAVGLARTHVWREHGGRGLVNPSLGSSSSAYSVAPRCGHPSPVSHLVGRSLREVRHSDKPLAKLGQRRAQVRLVVSLERSGDDRDAERPDAGAVVRDGEWLGT